MRTDLTCVEAMTSHQMLTLEEEKESGADPCLFKVENDKNRIREAFIKKR